MTRAHSGACVLLSATLVAMAACSFDPTASAPGGGVTDGAPFDAAAPIDSTPTDATPQPPPVHLLITEVKSNPLGSEFIEIFNPGCEAVDLSLHYLTDEPSYGLLPSWGDAPPELEHLDAVLRFPDGAVLEAGAVAVVARTEPGFTTAFGSSPDYTVRSPTLSPRMETVARGDTTDFEILDVGEPIVLFQWDRTSDLVVDVDVVVTGAAPPAGSQLAAKQDIAPGGVDGPDRNVIATLYANDAVTLRPMEKGDPGNSPTSGSYQRVLLEGLSEVSTGGNGVEGHDETSEDTRVTWEQGIGTTPTPGVVPAALRIPCVTP